MKKKSLFFIAMTVALATVVNLFAGVVAFADGADVIEIDSVDELKAVNDNLAGNYKLTANIDLGGEPWTPIGTTTNDAKDAVPFSGTFDGNGYTISNFTVTAKNDSSECRYGFFGVLTGTVKNLRLAKATYTADAENCASIGAFAGQLIGGTVSGCETAADVAIIVKNGWSKFRTGGIVGYGNGTIEYCVNRATITSSSTNDYYNGGIVGGFTNGTVSYCLNYGKLECTTKTKYAWLGGISGEMDNWTTTTPTIIEYCINFGTIVDTIDGADYTLSGIVSGTFGKQEKRLHHCINLGEVVSQTLDFQMIGWINAYKDEGYFPPVDPECNYGVGDANTPIVGNPNRINGDKTLGTTITTKEEILKTDTYKAIVAEVAEHLTGISTDLYGYQTTKEVDNKFDLRLVATLSGDYTTLANVGFAVSVSYNLDGAQVKETNKTVTKLYNSITATNAGEESVTEHTATSLGGDYIFVLACKGLPANATDITFTVTTFYTATGAQSSVYSEVETFVVEVPNDTLPTA